MYQTLVWLIGFGLSRKQLTKEFKQFSNYDKQIKHHISAVQIHLVDSLYIDNPNVAYLKVDPHLMEWKPS